jgi:hypothetical protein
MILTLASDEPVERDGEVKNGAGHGRFRFRRLVHAVIAFGLRLRSLRLPVSFAAQALRRTDFQDEMAPAGEGRPGSTC